MYEHAGMGGNGGRENTVEDWLGHDFLGEEYVKDCVLFGGDAKFREVRVALDWFRRLRWVYRCRTDGEAPMMSSRKQLAEQGQLRRSVAREG